MTETQDAIKAKLRACNIKPTQQRCDIAHAILNKPQHLFAEQVLYLVNGNEAYVSKATVYNTLNLFVDKVLVKKVVIDPAKIFYDSNTSHHYHYYNENTGELYDFEATDMKLDSSTPLPENTIQSGVDVIVRIRNST